MTTLLDDAVSELLASQQATAGMAVRYGRGVLDVELTAIPGRSQHESDGTGNEAIGARSRDWLIEPSDLVLEGETITPQRGDTVTLGDVVYEVVHRGESECFRWTDQTRRLIRVYSQEV